MSALSKNAKHTNYSSTNTCMRNKLLYLLNVYMVPLGITKATKKEHSLMTTIRYSSLNTYIFQMVICLEGKESNTKVIRGEKKRKKILSSR